MRGVVEEHDVASGGGTRKGRARSAKEWEEAPCSVNGSVGEGEEGKRGAEPGAQRRMKP